MRGSRGHHVVVRPGSRLGDAEAEAAHSCLHQIVEHYLLLLLTAKGEHVVYLKRVCYDIGRVSSRREMLGHHHQRLKLDLGSAVFLRDAEQPKACVEQRL